MAVSKLMASAKAMLLFCYIIYSLSKIVHPPTLHIASLVGQD